jgi:hypothetical protein
VLMQQREGQLQNHHKLHTIYRSNIEQQND